MATGRTTDAEFTAFFEATWARLFRTTYAVAGDRGIAEDALQTAFAKVYTSWAKVQQVEHPEAYVRRMAINEVLNQRRRGWLRFERTQRVPERPGQGVPQERVDDRTDVWAAVLRLPVRQRAVVVLRYYEGLSEAEIAETLGCSAGTVKSQAADALRKLRETYGATDPTTRRQV